jgi:hypothetical protein
MDAAAHEIVHEVVAAGDELEDAADAALAPLRTRPEVPPLDVDGRSRRDYLR